MKPIEEGKFVNEIKQKNGRFGWCVICRNKSNFYSVKFRFPICGHDCVSVLDSRYRELEDNITKKEIQIKIKDKKREMNKGINIVIYLCNLGKNEKKLDN
jgi:hypothetical protein